MSTELSNETKQDKIRKKIDQAMSYQRRKIRDEIKEQEIKIELQPAAGHKAKSFMFIFREGDFEKLLDDSFHHRAAKKIYTMFLTTLPSGTYKALETLMQEKSMRV